VTATKAAITAAIAARARVAEFLQNITDINSLFSGMSTVAESAETRFDEFNETSFTFIARDFARLRAQVEDLQVFIDDFSEISSCQFLPNAVDSINTTVCTTMVKCFDVLTLGLCTAGFFALPLIVVDECLIRMSKRNRKVNDVEMVRHVKRHHSKNAIYPEEEEALAGKEGNDS
jgi:hypothetical protein